MEERLVQFIALLRQNGVRVSMSEDLDGLRAAQLVGVEDAGAFRDALRATMVKRGVDAPIFDEVFELYFRGLGPVLGQKTESLSAALGLSREALDQLLADLERILKDLGVELSDLGRDLLRNDTGRLEQRLRQAGEAAQVAGIERSFQEGRYSHAVAQQMGLSGLASELESIKQRLEEAGLDDGMAESLRRLIDRRLQDLTDLIKRSVRQELEKRDPSLRETQQRQGLGEKNFSFLSEEEIRRMKEAVTKLAQRLRNVVSVRRRLTKRGRFDVKATLRRNLQYGGVPFRIRFDRRVKDKPQVIVLCDVSDSVRNVSRFMLQFVYSLQDLYSRVRSFIFVSDIGEVTRLFEEKEIEEALDESLTGDIINVYAHSDFGRAFRMFHRDFLSAVNHRTTVIVLGDARNNYNAAHEWVLGEIRQRAKQLVWLNPESRMTWGFGDSEMDRYLPHCDIVEECRNLNQLYRVIDRMMR